MGFNPTTYKNRRHFLYKDEFVMGELYQVDHMSVCRSGICMTTNAFDLKGANGDWGAIFRIQDLSVFQMIHIDHDRKTGNEMATILYNGTLYELCLTQISSKIYVPSD